MTRQEMELRRMEAVELFAAGKRKSEVAREMGVTRTTATRWAKAIAKGGAAAMRRRKAPGRPRTFDWSAHAEEIRALHAAADRFGRTAAGLALALAERYGTSYHPDHVSRIMKRLGIGRRRRAKVRQPYADVPPAAVAAPPTGFFIQRI